MQYCSEFLSYLHTCKHGDSYLPFTSGTNATDGFVIRSEIRGQAPHLHFIEEPKHLLPMVGRLTDIDDLQDRIISKHQNDCIDGDS